jgi:hypothetical protein
MVVADTVEFVSARFCGKLLRRKAAEALLVGQNIGVELEFVIGVSWLMSAVLELSGSGGGGGRWAIADFRGAAVDGLGSIVVDVEVIFEFERRFWLTRYLRFVLFIKDFFVAFEYMS